ncbi:Homeobox protein HD-1 [Nosema granulosis]|uniref:Homeobox protein HD-1 n=1 Tax=Nosema granulosis TaxID=83296 RepID=A0A9P6GZ58_9MICR|nr:Homeobox protein HD-1 [Nosema granulosis]
MSKSHDKIISKMNEIRLCYVETNNRICDMLDHLTSSFFQKNKKLQPRISNRIKQLVEQKLKYMREISVDNISFGLERYIEYLNESNSFLSDSSKTRRFPKKIIEALEKSFKVEQYPSDYEKARLSRICNLTPKQINNWFTNKRNRTKSYKNSMRY